MGWEGQREESLPQKLSLISNVSIMFYRSRTSVNLFCLLPMYLPGGNGMLIKIYQSLTFFVCVCKSMNCLSRTCP